MSNIVVLTGGGTAGHVAPNLALVPALQKQGYEVHYIGEKGGMEEGLAAAVPGVVFHPIHAGKLRRYFSLKNLRDAFRVVEGCRDANCIIRALRPRVIFSKGGFVTVPVCRAGKKYGVPVVLHESDLTPGLANRMSLKYAKKVLVTFEDTLPHTGGKGVYTGTPIRPELYEGDRARGLAFCGFSGEKPVLLVMGGSQGAQAVNEALWSVLPRLLTTFDVAHLCGKGKVNESLTGTPGYRQFEYVGPELKDVFAASAIALSRAGANSIFEFLALALPALLVPLPRAQSRGDQILNARYFEKKGFALCLEQEELTGESLLSSLFALYRGRERYRAAMKAEPNADGTQAVLREILSAAGEA